MAQNRKYWKPNIQSYSITRHFFSWNQQFIGYQTHDGRGQQMACISSKDTSERSFLHRFAQGSGVKRSLKISEGQREHFGKAEFWRLELSPFCEGSL